MPRRREKRPLDAQQQHDRAMSEQPPRPTPAQAQRLKDSLSGRGAGSSLNPSSPLYDPAAAVKARKGCSDAQLEKALADSGMF